MIAPHLPARKRHGRPRTTDLREMLNAILYMACTGCQWRMLPKELPPRRTIQRYFYTWRSDGMLRALIHRLLMAARETAGHEACPSAVLIDSQWVKTTESGSVRGFDAGKTIKGRKRHIVTDTGGFLVGTVVHTADIQDRDSAPAVLASTRYSFPWLRHVVADGGYTGPKLKAALTDSAPGRWRIVKRSNAARGFVLLPRRWVVERTFAWLNRKRRIAKDFEETIESAEAWLLIASIQLLCCRIARA